MQNGEKQKMPKVNEITKSVIALINDTEYLRNNIIIEAKRTRSTQKKIEWVKEFLNDGFLDEATWLSNQFSQIVISLCDWEAVLEHFKKMDKLERELDEFQ